MSDLTLQKKGLAGFVACVCIAAVAAMCLAWQIRAIYPGTLALMSTCIVASLLDRSKMKYRVGAAAALFGGFWGGLITGVSSAIDGVVQRKPIAKTLFNVGQLMLSVVVASLVYQVALGGSLPPAFLTSGGVSAAIVQKDLFLFFVLVTVYVLLNKVLVAAVVSISQSRPFREVWHLNSRGIVGFDLGAGVLAAIMAWFYVRAESLGYGPIGLIFLVLPYIALRYVYSMYQGVQDSGQELLQVMVKAIEARDPYTSGHSLRVRELSRAIALELQLSAQQIEEVETAALLHDVGKIHEEFAPLLRKESRLTDEETALMQTHAAKSAELVGIISKFRGSIQQSVRHHHERWDGQGYPDGITSTAIPLASRIILIADTIDAMTTDRPYRKRLSLDIVIAELQKCRGTQFDPAIVDVAVSSVAVRRLIAGPPGTEEESVPLAPRSLRVTRPSGAFWKTKRA
jgi:hypothetical protein